MSFDVSPQASGFGNLAPEQIQVPRSVGELQEYIRDARHNRARLLIAGGGTRLAYGNSGGPFDRVLTTRNLNQIIHYEPDDMTLAVEPGCTIKSISTLLEASGQSIALDVAHSERATIGGSYATGLSGPRRLSGGSLKDWVIGVEVAGFDGTIARAGGMVVKNVTGFDMMHLHYGALGAFGVVTRLNLKVFPDPGARRSIRLTFDNVDNAHTAAIALLGSQLQPCSILIANDGGWHVHVRMDAPSTAIDRLAERAVDTANGAAPSADVVIVERGDAALEPFTRAVNLTTGRVIARIPVVATRQLDLLRYVPQSDAVEVCADVGSGLVYLTSMSRQPIADILEHGDWQPTWLSLPTHLRRDTDIFGPLAAPAADVVRRLKDTFDPDRQLNPGRFVLGL